MNVSMQDIWNALSAVSLLQWTLLVAVWLITNGLIYLAFARWVFRRQWRLFQNLKRPVIVLTPMSEGWVPMADSAMGNEIHLLKASGFLNVAAHSGDYRMFDPAGKHCVVVLGYRPGMIGLGDVLQRMKQHHVPLIVYTYGNNRALAGADQDLLNQYPYMLPANFPLTLLNHIFATVASYSYEHS